MCLPHARQCYSPWTPLWPMGRGRSSGSIAGHPEHWVAQSNQPVRTSSLCPGNLRSGGLGPIGSSHPCHDPRSGQGVRVPVGGSWQGEARETAGIYERRVFLCYKARSAKLSLQVTAPG